MTNTSKQTSSLLTCVVRIISYRSSLGAGTGAGFFTDRESCLILPLTLLVFVFGGEDLPSCALWSSSRRPCAVATRSKNSSFCSEVMEEKTTVKKWERKELKWSKSRGKAAVSGQGKKHGNMVAENSWVRENGWLHLVLLVQHES